MSDVSLFKPEPPDAFAKRVFASLEALLLLPLCRFIADYSVVEVNPFCHTSFFFASAAVGTFTEGNTTFRSERPPFMLDHHMVHLGAMRALRVGGPSWRVRFTFERWKSTCREFVFTHEGGELSQCFVRTYDENVSVLVTLDAHGLRCLLEDGSQCHQLRIHTPDTPMDIFPVIGVRLSVPMTAAVVVDE